MQPPGVRGILKYDLTNGSSETYELAEYEQEQPNAYRVMFHLEQEPKNQRPEVDKEVRRAFGVLLTAVRAAVEGGFMAGDPVTIAHLLWAKVHGLISLHRAGKLTMGRTLAELREVPGIAFAQGNGSKA